MVFTGTPYCLIDYLIGNILFSRNEFTYGNNKKRKIFNSDLPGLQLMKINKMPTESCLFICKCENRNKGFAPFSAKFVDSITVFIINVNLLLASPDSL